ncbi:hypothetical protein ACEZDB_20250 [Streptacidiphilus sp. N1-3]|uniref:Uncharacterized protein n=1 Tax=Streptacidiphilus alkalitolerans TaxID=3342712 RepID=A0ABV6X3W0_9ACTN
MKTRHVWTLLAAAAAVVALLLHFFAKVRLADLLAVGLGGVLLFWQVLLLTVPWSLYFQARQVVTETATSRERGIQVPEGRGTDAARIARRLRLLAIGGHLVTAAVVAVITYFSGRTVGYYFSGFYLVSTVFRPAQAYLAHIRGQLRTMLKETRFPRDDIQELKAGVERAEAERASLHELLHQLELRIGEQSEQIARSEVDAARRSELVESRLADRADQIEARATARADQLETRFAARSDQVAQQVQALARRFEDALDSYTDNQELVAGLKAFLRMLRADQT